MKTNTIFLGIIALSLATLAAVQVGAIRPAHAISLNRAVKLINASITASEKRIIEEIGEQCAMGSDTASGS